jgi:hypothetical protein
MADDQPPFIALSPVVREEGTLPHRIVIREVGDQYVVHTQILEPGAQSWFHNGDYFPKRAGSAAALANAWERFQARSRVALRMRPVKATSDLKDIICVLAGRIESLLSDEEYDDEKCIRLAMVALHEHGWHDDADDLGRRRTIDPDMDENVADDM